MKQNYKQHQYYILPERKSQGRGNGIFTNMKGGFCMKFGEAIEEMKAGEKRQNAIDMMKHIAAAWGISADEVFGGQNDGDDD